MRGKATTEILQPPKLSGRLLWVGRACFLITIVGILIVTLCFYHPRNMPISGLSPQIGQTVWYVGWLVALTAYAWIWPATGGIFVIIYGGLSIWGLVHDLTASDAMRQVVAPAHFPLYAIFITGGTLNLIAALKQRRPAYRGARSESGKLKLLRWAARIMLIASLIAFIIFFHPHGWSWIILGCFPASILIGIAWVWPALGGTLLIAFDILTLFIILRAYMGSGSLISTAVPLLTFWSVFLAGGILHAYLGRTQK
jgi:hypothetical protein